MFQNFKFPRSLSEWCTGVIFFFHFFFDSPHSISSLLPVWFNLEIKVKHQHLTASPMPGIKPCSLEPYATVQNIIEVSSYSSYTWEKDSSTEPSSLTRLPVSNFAVQR